MANDRIGMPWLFIKEISSDGDVSTVDVIYPAAPFFLQQNPEALRLIMEPVLEYAANGTGLYSNNNTGYYYNKLYAPHHLGSWPVCDITPAEQENMPVEETGNMLLLLSAYARYCVDEDEIA